MIKIIASLYLLICFFSILTVATPVYAHSTGVANVHNDTNTETNKPALSPAQLTNPLGVNTTPQSLIGRAINALLGVVGSLALIMFIYGGVVWMTAAGNSERASKAQKILLWATIGLVIIFASYSIVNFLINTAILGNPTEVPTTN